MAERATRTIERDPDPASPKLAVRDLTVRRPQASGGTIVAATEVTFEVATGEFVCLLGPSGCGKTSILNVLAGLDRASSGAAFVDGRPIATGIAAVGDAWACTNPSAGRGVSVGLIHAQCLRDAFRAEPDDREAFAIAFAKLTEARAAPYFWSQIDADRARVVEMDALRAGDAPPPPDPRTTALERAVMHDADVFRAMLEVRMCLATPQEVFARPGFAERVDAHADEEPMQMPGPSREELTQLLG